MIEECITIHSKAAFDKSITFEIKIDAHLPNLKADVMKLKQIFVGLFTRAIRYSSQNKKIAVKATKQNRDGLPYAKIVVRDNGFGLSDEMIINLEKNLDPRHERDYMEMDFSAMERLIKLHQGTFTASSEPGKGTAVSLFFPLFSTPEVSCEHYSQCSNFPLSTETLHIVPDS